MFLTRIGLDQGGDHGRTRSIRARAEERRSRQTASWPVRARLHALHSADVVRHPLVRKSSAPTSAISRRSPASRIADATTIARLSWRQLRSPRQLSRHRRVAGAKAREQGTSFSCRRAGSGQTLNGYRARTTRPMSRVRVRWAKPVRAIVLRPVRGRKQGPNRFDHCAHPSSTACCNSRLQATPGAPRYDGGARRRFSTAWACRTRTPIAVERWNLCPINRLADLLERLSAFLTREPEDREELLDLLHGAFERKLLDADAL